MCAFFNGTCGEAAEFASDIAKIIAGEGNPVTVRINNGNYTPAGARGLSRVAFRAAVEKIHIGDGVDAILAETDTCPLSSKPFYGFDN